MTAAIRRSEHDARGALEVTERFRSEGLAARSWSNGPGERYSWHSHPHDKVLYCVRGSITFHGREGDHPLGAGDRLEVDAGTEHAATVGPDGVECMEAAR